MGKCYCDYCDVFLTHDSASVRKQHNDGNRHRQNVSEYYRQYIARATQERIDDIVRGFELRLAKGLVVPTYGVSAIDGRPAGAAATENREADGPEERPVEAEETDGAMVSVETRADPEDAVESPKEDVDSDADLVSSSKSSSQTPSKRDLLSGSESGAESGARAGDQLQSLSNGEPQTLVALSPKTLHVDGAAAERQELDSRAVEENAERDDGSDMDLDDD